MFDIANHRAWEDFKAWLEYRDERDRIEREKEKNVPETPVETETVVPVVL